MSSSRSSGSRRLITILALAPLLLAGACAAEPLRSQGSLLDDSESVTSVCLPAAGQVGYTYGSEMLRNVEASPVTITAVLPTNPNNLTVQDIYLVPISDGSPVGNGVWPPAAAKVTGLQDPSLRSYTDLVVPPRSAAPATSYNLVLQLAPVGTSPAGFDGLRIEYTADNREFYQLTGHSLVIRQTC